MKKIYCVPVIILLFFAAACSRRTEQFALNGFAEGTTYHIVYNHHTEVIRQSAVDSLFDVLDRSLSLYNPDSRLSRINRGETDTLDAHIKECLEIALRLSGESEGMYDVTVKPLISAIGFAAETAQENPDMDSIMNLVGYKKIRIDDDRLVRSVEGVQIDLNSVAKGYSVDALSGFLRQKGLRDFIVEVGGEIYCQGTKNGELWRVGIDKPVDNNFFPGENLQTIIRMDDGGLATSGNYRRFYFDKNGRRVHHTVNPLTGRSVSNTLLSATVIAPSCALADAYATMFMVMGLEKSMEFLEKRPDLSAYFVYSDDNNDFRVYVTDNLTSRITE